jgi:cardiolipin synthase A/B
MARRLKTAGWLLAGVVIALLVVAVARGRWARIGDQFSSSQLAPTATISAGGGLHGVFIEPQDGVAPITDEIDAARKSVDVEVYLLTSDEIIASLKRANGRGAHVRVIIERQPYKSEQDKSFTKSQLEAKGFQVRFGPSRYTYTHAKFMVIDGLVGVVSTANFTYSAFTSNRDLGVTTTVPREVAELSAVFEADWRDAPTPSVKTLILSPTNARDAMMSLVAGAKTRIDVYAEEMYDDKMVRAFISARKRGVRVRILVPPSTDQDQLNQIGRLTEAGVEVRTLNSPTLHAKMILIDDARVFVGSQNMSANSIEHNREVGLILTEAANVSRLAKAFQRDFTSS